MGSYRHGSLWMKIHNLPMNYGDMEKIENFYALTVGMGDLLFFFGV